MKAIILAAGRGSRMKGFTDDVPKCLVKLAGKTLLERQLAALRSAGVDEIAIVRGYHGELLEGFGATLFENPDWQTTNMVASLRCAGRWLSSGDCIVSYSDIFYGAATISRLIQAKGLLAVAYDPDWRWLWEKRFADPLSDAESFRLNSGGEIVDIGRRTATYDDVQGQYMGLLRFCPATWTKVVSLLDGMLAADAGRIDMTSLLSRLIHAGVTIDAVPIAERWGEVDAASDLFLYEELALREAAFSTLLAT